jgi:hypothetical protein
MRALVLILVLAVAACTTRNDSDTYCPNADCILHLCQCGSDSCSGSAPQACGSDADCGSGNACTFEFDDTQQCSPTCNPDGTGCPSGYTCQTFVP